MTKEAEFYFTFFFFYILLQRIINKKIQLTYSVSVSLTATHHAHLLPLLVQLLPQREGEAGPMSRAPCPCVQG